MAGELQTSSHSNSDRLDAVKGMKPIMMYIISEDTHQSSIYMNEHAPSL